MQNLNPFSLYMSVTHFPTLSVSQHTQQMLTSALKSFFFLPHLHLEFSLCVGNMHIFPMTYFPWVLASQFLPQIHEWGAPLRLLPTGWQWYFPLTLQLTSQAAQVCLAWHRNLSLLAATGVDDLFFLFSFV